MASCSKAPRGLFVLLWVGRVLTAIAISPSPWSRHCPDRDAFRAGRNLPDKEFRYLRTVIVTAAVHRGFGSELSPLPLTFRHWAGISPYTSSCDFSTDLWFCYPVAWASLLRLPARSARKGPHPQEHPFYQRYGVKLPSSLTRDHSSTLACSASLPVSVCGTGTHHSPRIGLSCLFRRRRLAVVIAHPARTCLSVNDGGTNPRLPTSLNGARLAARHTPQHPVLVKRLTCGTGLSTRCPSGSACAYPLGPTTPPRITRAAEP
jgi:hypothetical protein